MVFVAYSFDCNESHGDIRDWHTKQHIKTVQYVFFEKPEDGFTVIFNGQISPVSVDTADYSGVSKVAAYLQSDIKLVTGDEPVISS